MPVSVLLKYSQWLVHTLQKAEADIHGDIIAIDGTKTTKKLLPSLFAASKDRYNDHLFSSRRIEVRNVLCNLRSSAPNMEDASKIGMALLPLKCDADIAITVLMLKYIVGIEENS